MNPISNLPYYVLFVFKDLKGDVVYSTTDIKTLKTFTISDNFSVGNQITFLDEIYKITEVSVSNVGGTLFNNYKFGWSNEGVIPAGEVKDSMLRLTIFIEKQLS